MILEKTPGSKHSGKKHSRISKNNKYFKTEMVVRIRYVTHIRRLANWTYRVHPKGLRFGFGLVTPETNLVPEFYLHHFLTEIYLELFSKICWI